MCKYTLHNMHTPSSILLGTNTIRNIEIDVKNHWHLRLLSPRNKNKLRTISQRTKFLVLTFLIYLFQGFCDLSLVLAVLLSSIFRMSEQTSIKTLQINLQCHVNETTKTVTTNNKNYKSFLWMQHEIQQEIF